MNHNKNATKKERTKYDPSKLAELDEAVVDCIIEDSRPFGDFSKPGLKKFINNAIPGYSAPSRFTIKRKINEKYKIQKIS